jgi:ribose-phosphate pyrophosphokinase
VGRNPYGIKIKSRLNTFRDLELIICATQALREIGVKTIRLYIPYCIGARSDRKFVEGGINYVKHVIAPIINSQGYDSVTILDPHSDVLEACINNFHKEDNTKLVWFAMDDYFGSKGFKTWNKSIFENVCLVSPDSGALKKVFNVAEAIRYTGEIVIASKHTNLETGKIDYTNVPLDGVINRSQNLDFFIFDDICDGGRTFIEIAKVIRKTKPEAKCYLCITHGIFSAGLYELSQWFERIYCTNSVKDLNVEEYSDYTVDKDFIKQLNVF